MMKKLILTLIAAVLALVIVLFAAARYVAGGGEEPPPRQQEQQGEASPVDILEFSIGDSVGTVEHRTEGGKDRYVICITLPAETDFKNCVANITLPEGAAVSQDSPCYRSELGGRPVLDLTLENRDLIIENGSESRSYGFEINLTH